MSYRVLSSASIDSPQGAAWVFGPCMDKILSLIVIYVNKFRQITLREVFAAPKPVN